MWVSKLSLGLPHTCTHRARIPQAVFECTSVIVARHIPFATHGVVNVVAQARTCRFFFAGSDAELGGGHEVLAERVNTCHVEELVGTDRPLVQLLQLSIVEHTGEDQATDGIA